MERREEARATSVYDLAERWRARAREQFSETAVRALTACADELDVVLEQWLKEPLKLRAAAAECGFSEDALGRMVRAGKLKNVGRPGAPRVRRGDLPRKAAGQLNRPKWVNLEPRGGTKPDRGGSR